MEQKIYYLENLDCANCAAKIEDKIAKLEGVESATVSFLTEKCIRLPMRITNCGAFSPQPATPIR